MLLHFLRADRMIDTMNTKETLQAEKEKIEGLLAAYKEELDFGDPGDDKDPHGEEADEAEEIATYAAVKEVLEKRLKTIEQQLHQ